MGLWRQFLPELFPPSELLQAGTKEWIWASECLGAKTTVHQALQLPDCVAQGSHLISPLSLHLKNGYNVYLNPGILYILGQAINPSKPVTPSLHQESFDTS